MIRRKRAACAESEFNCLPAAYETAAKGLIQRPEELIGGQFGRSHAHQ